MNKIYSANYSCESQESNPEWAFCPQSIRERAEKVRWRSAVRSSVSFHPRGVSLVSGCCRVAGKVPLQKRGKIKGWSLASRRRLREYLLQHRFPDGCSEYAVTLTVPGPPLSGVEAKKVWHHYQVVLRQNGLMCVWRREIQKRGAVHWHLVVGVPAGWRWEGKNVILESSPESVQFALSSWWLRVLDTLGECVHAVSADSRRVPLAGGGNGGTVQCVRSALSGAWSYAVQSEFMGDKGLGWVRYILDHASKAKQAQECESGRAWGVVGAKGIQAAPSVSQDLTRAGFVRLLRVLRKWGRPRIKNDRAAKSCGVWDTHLGFQSSRGRRGRSVWFGDPDVFRRAVSWCESCQP